MLMLPPRHRQSRCTCTLFQPCTCALRACAVISAANAGPTCVDCQPCHDCTDHHQAQDCLPGEAEGQHQPQQEHANSNSDCGRGCQTLQVSAAHLQGHTMTVRQWAGWLVQIMTQLGHLSQTHSLCGAAYLHRSKITLACSDRQMADLPSASCSSTRRRGSQPGWALLSCHHAFHTLLLSMQNSNSWQPLRPDS